ncbi:MAG: amino acid-binding protein [Firmicutes bacterium]|nr:amino acid-binding protein [Bacillota bacterium]
MVKQISIFLENKCGRMISVSQALGEAGINIRALSIADTSDFGILRLIVNEPDKACTVLREKGFMASVTEVIAVEVPDVPGGLTSVLLPLESAGINIEYLYAFLQKRTENALILMRVDNILAALQVLQKKGIPMISSERIYDL